LAKSGGSRFISLAKTAATHKMRFAFAQATAVAARGSPGAALKLKEIVGNQDHPDGLVISELISSTLLPHRGFRTGQPALNLPTSWRLPLTNARPVAVDHRRSSSMRRPNR
jgi:hypothetical protein